MNNQFHLQRNLLGGGWVNVTNSPTSAVVRLVDGVANDALATDNRMTGSALGFVAGEYDEDGATANITLQNSHTEMHFIVSIIGADVNNNDTIQLRAITGVSELTEYHQIPTVTAVEGGTTFFQSLSGSAVASPIIVKQVNLSPLSAGSVASATMTQSLTFMQALSAGATAAASIIKQVNTSLVATAAAAAAIIKQTNLSARIASVIASAGIVKQTNLSPLSAGATASATMAQSLTFMQSLSSSAVASAVLSTAATFAEALSAGATATASIVKQINKGLSATVSAVAAIVKQTAKSMTATVSALGVVATATTFVKSLTATVSAVATLLAELVVTTTSGFVGRCSIIYSRVRNALKQINPTSRFRR